MFWVERKLLGTVHFSKVQDQWDVFSVLLLSRFDKGDTAPSITNSYPFFNPFSIWNIYNVLDCLIFSYKDAEDTQVCFLVCDCKYRVFSFYHDHHSFHQNNATIFFFLIQKTLGTWFIIIVVVVVVVIIVVVVVVVDDGQLIEITKTYRRRSFIKIYHIFCKCSNY